MYLAERAFDSPLRDAILLDKKGRSAWGRHGDGDGSALIDGAAAADDDTAYCLDELEVECPKSETMVSKSVAGRQRGGVAAGDVTVDAKDGCRGNDAFPAPRGARRRLLTDYFSGGEGGAGGASQLQPLHDLPAASRGSEAAAAPPAAADVAVSVSQAAAAAAADKENKAPSPPPKANSSAETRWAQRGAELVSKMRARISPGEETAESVNKARSQTRAPKPPAARCAGGEAEDTVVADLTGRLAAAAGRGRPGTDVDATRRTSTAAASTARTMASARGPASSGRLAAYGAPVAMATRILALPAPPAVPNMPVLLAPPLFEAMERPSGRSPHAGTRARTRGGGGGGGKREEIEGASTSAVSSESGGRDANGEVADAAAVLSVVSEEWQVKRRERESRHKARREAREAAGGHRDMLTRLKGGFPAETSVRTADGGAAASVQWGSPRCDDAAAPAGKGVVVASNKVRVERVWTVSGDGSEVMVQSREVQVTGKKL